MPPPSEIPHGPVSAQVLTRFALRLVMLAVFATLGLQGFAKTLESLLVLAACYCVVVGGIRREAPLGPLLTHYDEAAAYGLGIILASWVA